MKKKLFSFLLVVAMAISIIPLNCLTAYAETNNIATIYAENVCAAPGDIIEVAISIKDNPGISGATITVSFSPKLTLTQAVNGATFSTLQYTEPGALTSPCNFTWDSENTVTNENGEILKLSFKVSESAVENEVLPVNVSYVYGDIYDGDLSSITVDFVNGGIKVLNYLPGDVNGDLRVNGKDVTLIRRFIAGGYDISINEAAADVNEDGRINGKDVTLIRRYIAGGYGVVLKPSSSVCKHSMESFAPHPATCTEDGNIAYWHCGLCNKYFKDENGNTVTSLEETIIRSEGHAIVIDQAVPATYTLTGLTEGKHCSKCNLVIQEQVVIPKLHRDEYSIEYFINGNDNYLAGISINNPNPKAYYSDAGVAWLEELVVPGYNFEGWFDGQGSAASRVTSIPAGTSRNIKLYAKWTKTPYIITLDNSAMNLPSKTITYTVDQKVTLDKPAVDRYVFLGWTTAKDELITEIKPGTTGNFTLYSNWTSKRNLTKPVNKLGKPIIVEDTIEGKILFTYEIGQIENVPLYTIKELPSAGGVVSVFTQTISKAISKTDALTIAKSIDHVTTDSTAWTLSEDWNETTHIEDSTLAEHGFDRTTGQSLGKTSSNTYTLTKKDYDNTVVKSNEGSVATTTEYGTTDVNTRETWESKANLSVSDKESAKYASSTYVNTEVGAEGFGVSAKIGAGMESSSEIRVDSEIGSGVESIVAHENTSHTKSGTDTVTVEDNLTTTTTNKGWDKSRTISNNSASCFTQSEQETLSEKIAEEFRYGERYAKGGSNSSSADWSSSIGESEQYSSTFTYFNSEETTDGVSYQINGEADGSYRLVRAGIVHVFAVVMYDIATAQYSVATYSVLDDTTYPYIDYSATSAAKFDDNENGVLPFEIPIFVNDYVNGRIISTEGLRFNETALSTAEYVGTNTSVIVPEFFGVDNHDGTHSAYTVRNLSTSTFSGKTNIKSVLLSNFMREIPDYAFAGCTDLQLVYGSEISYIGANAFNGCTSLGEFKISSTVQSIGTNAFKDVNSIVVTASNRDVVFGAINSGAKRITINISAIADEMNNTTLEIPSTVEYFELQGGRNTFTGLTIKSEAGTTVLNGMTIICDSGIPLDISSEHVTLNQVNATSSNFVLLLKGLTPTVSLYGTNKLISGSTNAVVSRNTTLTQISSTVSANLEVTGNFLNCGSFSNPSLTSFPSRGTIVSISDEDYLKYIKGMFTITLNLNGGTLPTGASDIVEAYLGESIYNLLPTPQRDYHTFDGWYTQDGTKITPDTVFDNPDNIVLEALWNIFTYTLTFNANGGNVSTGSRTLSYNAPYGDLPTPTRTGYTFDGWYTSATGGSKVNSSDTIQENTTVYAHWNAIPYTLSFDANGGSSVSTKTLSYGEQYGSLPTPTRIGYSFDGWYTSATGGSKVSSSYTIQGNTIVYAHWTAKTVNYSVSYVSVNGTQLGYGNWTSQFGTTATCSPQSFGGYQTPSAQKIYCDSETKNIVFTYTPLPVNSAIVSGQAVSSPPINYSVTIEQRNRTTNSIQIRLNWTHTIEHGYNDLGQNFNASCGSASTGRVIIVPTGTWHTSKTTPRSVTVSSDWITVNVGAQDTMISLNVYFYQTTPKDNLSSGASFNETWNIEIPAY